jgi:sporulation protein YlmC with PRC-barrel domain
MAYFFGPADTNGLIGAEVRSSDGATVARIEDLVIDANDGRVVLFVFDNVSGRGDTLVAVPFGELSMSGNAFVFNADGTKLASAPEFRGADLGDQRKAEDIYLFFGAQPYWTTGGGASMEEHHSDDMGPAMED